MYQGGTALPVGPADCTQGPGTGSKAGTQTAGSELYHHLKHLLGCNNTVFESCVTLRRNGMEKSC